MSEITLAETLKKYRVISTDLSGSIRAYANEKFSKNNIFNCTEEEQQVFSKRLKESQITITNNVKSSVGALYDLQYLISLVRDPRFINVPKLSRPIFFTTSLGKRPIGNMAWENWNGFQVIDMDIKDSKIAEDLKTRLFTRLYKYNWFLGVVTSSSGKGLHIYTKIKLSEQQDSSILHKIYLTNFRHKYSFVYLATRICLEDMGLNFNPLEWLDMAMSKPQQGAIIPYDNNILINSNFFEDWIYINFDNCEALGDKNIDWVTYPELEEHFKKQIWFEKGDERKIDVEIKSAEDLNIDTKTKVHYKHDERWRLANTLVKIYGFEKGFTYLRHICSNTIKDSELRGDCFTASRHKKPIDIWAINKLNNLHGFKIKINISKEEETEDVLYNNLEKISNPMIILPSKNSITININKKQYLGSVKDQIINELGKITLLEAGAGLGKTEMVKAFAKEKKIIMVMPFTSTIKAKIEEDQKMDNWQYSYGNKKVDLKDCNALALTIDKFSKMNLMEIKEYGFDYIFIDESHLLFQSDYRPVMPRVVDQISQSEVPIIMMTGTPFAETVFFPNLKHIHVIKEETREKIFKVNITGDNKDNLFHMCEMMAKDVSNGVKVLFPTNQGSLYKTKIQVLVNYFLQTRYFLFNREARIEYYKKSNSGEEFMEDIDKKQNIDKVDILLCSNYLSVGVDIKTKYKFHIYFNELWMPQDVEQFANRIRGSNLYIDVLLPSIDPEGNVIDLYSYKQENFKLNEEDKMSCISIIRICNDMIERNGQEYKYNPMVASIINGNKYIEYSESDDKYILNNTAFKVVQFEKKYRKYVEQLPILIKGMQCYGYEFSTQHLNTFKLTENENISEIETLIKEKKKELINIKTNAVDELLDLINEGNLYIFKQILEGTWEVRKGANWKIDIDNNKIIVKDIEIFDKVLPLFVSMAKLYSCENVRDIFGYCCDKKDNYNFAAIRRMRLLINILYNTKISRLDIPIKNYIQDIKDLIDNNEVIGKDELSQFLIEHSHKYLQLASTKNIQLNSYENIILKVNKYLEDIFKCVVDTKIKNKVIKMSLVDVFWIDRETEEKNKEKVFLLDDFIDNFDIYESKNNI